MPDLQDRTAPTATPPPSAGVCLSVFFLFCLSGSHSPWFSALISVTGSPSPYLCFFPPRPALLRLSSQTTHVCVFKLEVKTVGVKGELRSGEHWSQIHTQAAKGPIRA